MNRCADCSWIYDEREAEDDGPVYRCGYQVPFWVPLPITDYRSWVMPDDGAKCRAFKKKE